MSKVYEILATISYRVMVDVDGDNPEAAMTNFNEGRFREVYVAGADMSDWEANSRPVEVDL